jgi:hypothetical protein
MSWINTKVRKGAKSGIVISDDKSRVFRVLKVKFDDETKGEIWLANYGLDPQETQEFEWYCECTGSSIDKTWVRF